MSFNFQDPAFLIPVVAILVCSVLLVWALGRLFKKAPDSFDSPLPDDSFLPSRNDVLDVPLPSDAIEPPPTREAPPRAGTGTNREMTDRLDGMAQKLSDMQTVLQRQASSTPSGAPLTPETIDKLLKIIGNMTQQVDILQKSLATVPTLGAPAPAAASTPAAPAPSPKPAAAPAPAPTATPNPAPPIGGKSLGVAGGALSSFSRPAPAAQPPAIPKPAAAPGVPPTNPANPPPGK